MNNAATLYNLKKSKKQRVLKTGSMDGYEGPLSSNVWPKVRFPPAAAANECYRLSTIKLRVAMDDGIQSPYVVNLELVARAKKMMMTDQRS